MQLVQCEHEMGRGGSGRPARPGLEITPEYNNLLIYRQALSATPSRGHARLVFFFLSRPSSVCLVSSGRDARPLLSFARIDRIRNFALVREVGQGQPCGCDSGNKGNASTRVSAGRWARNFQSPSRRARKESGHARVRAHTQSTLARSLACTQATTQQSHEQKT